MKKLTIADPKGGEPTQVGFAIRSKGAPVGITDKFLPFAHAWGARMLSPDLDKATGYANSPQMVAALTFFGDLVNKDKVASLAFGNPEDAFGQKRARGHLPRVVVLRLAEEERARRELQGLRAALRKGFALARAPCSRGPTSFTRTARTSKWRGSSCGSSAIPRTTWSIISCRGSSPCGRRTSIART